MDLHYYDLYIKPTPINNSAKIDKVLMVDDIWTSQHLWHQGMIIRKSSYRMKHYPFKQWTKTPEELIEDTVIQYYKSSHFFSHVVDEHSSMEPDIVMQIHADALEMMYEDKQWFARLALDIEFVDSETEKVFLKHIFDRKLKIKGRNPRYVPEKISQILQEELVKIVEKLKEFSY